MEKVSDDGGCVIAAATRVDDPVPSFDVCGEEDCCLANKVAKVQKHQD